MWTSKLLREAFLTPANHANKLTNNLHMRSRDGLVRIQIRTKRGTAMSTTRQEDFIQLAEGVYLEGLAVDYTRNIVWYSDVIAGGIHGVSPNGHKVTSFNAKRMWTGGILINDDGAVISSGAGGIMWNHPDTDASGWLVNEIDGKPINGINEMIPDGTGGIFFGTVDIEHIIKGEPTRPASIYRLTPNREVTLAAGELGFVNGIMLSADRQQLYYNDTFDSTYIFDVLPDLTLTNRRRLMEKVDCDGMALDAKGTLWVTGFRSSEITRVGADGSIQSPIATPAGAITQVRFGGTDMRDVYFTSVPADGGDSLKVGVQLTAKRSFLYRTRSEAPGMRIPPTRFRLGFGDD
jgi:sugar lactone lactonase YvrE